MTTRFRQAIHIGSRVTDTVFRLGCIYSVHKEADGGICYLLYDWDEQGQYVELRPGQWLCEDCDGRWHVFSDEEYKNVEEQTKNNEDDSDRQQPTEACTC